MQNDARFKVGEEVVDEDVPEYQAGLITDCFHSEEDDDWVYVILFSHGGAFTRFNSDHALRKTTKLEKALK